MQAIAQTLGTKIYCDSRKSAILRCQADQELQALLTANPAEANVPILPLGAVTSDSLRSYLQRFKGTFSRIVGFRPTGWTWVFQHFINNCPLVDFFHSYSPPSGSVSSPNASIQSIMSRGQSRHFSSTHLQPSQKSSYNVQIFGVPCAAWRTMARAIRGHAERRTAIDKRVHRQLVAQLPSSI